MRKTKIICTIGPASDNEQILRAMCKSGMNVARLNFSHGTHEGHAATIAKIKSVRESLGLPIAIMLDTKGPEYRIKTFENGKITLKDGDKFTFTTEDRIGNQEIVSVNYERLTEDLNVNDTIMVNNGLVKFNVDEISGNNVNCTVVAGGVISDNGGVMSNRKSMNFPNKVLKKDYLSEQDKADLLFGIEHDVDFVAASFVSSKKDALAVRKFLDDNGGKEINIIAKIENRAGVDNIEEICDIADGVMVARGALGNPWLIKDSVDYIDNNIKNERPTKKEIYDMIMLQHKYLLDLKGEHLAMLEMRSHVGWYLKGMPGAAPIKNACNMQKDFNNVLNILKKFLID